MSTSDSLPQREVILVTGANKGIGYEAVKLLSVHRPSSTILLGSRSTANGEAAISKMKESDSSHSFDNVQVVALDLADTASIVNAARQVQSSYQQLDVLVNNAGIASVDDNMKHRSVIDVNLYGTHSCIEQFLPLMPASSIVINVISRQAAVTTHSATPELQQRLLDPASITWPDIDRLAQLYFDTTGLNPWPPADKTFGCYGVSKALLCVYTRRLAIDHRQLRVALTTPGHCRTDMSAGTKFPGSRTAEQGGASVVWPILHPQQAFDAQGGQCKFFLDGDEHPWSVSQHPTLLKQTESAEGGERRDP